MPDLTLVLDKETIARKVAEVARQISADYKEADLVLIGVLKGAFVFMADLMRRLEVAQVAVDFVRLASYGFNCRSSERIRLLKDFEIDIQNRDVLIVEDILDTGLTVAYLKQHLQKFNPRSVKVCVLIDKYERRQVELQADYVCQRVTAGFLVGYGLDYAEAYRNLPGIFNLNL
jgi:hypoxanthine phosphoribosyltransferase